MFLAEFGTGQVFWSMLWFFLFFIWIWLLIAVFSDIFRSHDLSGWGKALWVDLRDLPAVPRRVRVPDRARRQDAASTRVEAAQAQDAAVPRSTSRAPPARAAASPADELARLADLRDQGRHHRRRVRAGEGEGAVLTKRRQPLR